MNALRIQNLRKTYRNGTVALRGISLTIDEGEFVALLGPNGAGKTTTINILAGNTVKSSGSVVVGGYDLDTQALDVKRTIGVVPQELSFDSFFTVNELMRYQCGYFGMRPDQAHIDRILAELSLLDKKGTNTRSLSGGMKRRLLIAKSLVHTPHIFVLDEPTAGVDLDLRQTLYDSLRNRNRAGQTIILTTHYLEEAEKLCDRIIVIHDGRIVADESKEALLQDRSLEEVFLCLTKR